MPIKDEHFLHMLIDHWYISHQKSTFMPLTNLSFGFLNICHCNTIRLHHISCKSPPHQLPHALYFCSQCFFILSCRAFDPQNLLNLSIFKTESISIFLVISSMSSMLAKILSQAEKNICLHFFLPFFFSFFHICLFDSFGMYLGT